MRALIAAAAAGNPEAQFNLGVMYDNRIDDQGNATGPTDDNGYTISSNRAEAMRWLQRAAEQGLTRAQARLAELYAEATDEPETRIKACKWFTLARANSSGFRLDRVRAGYDRICARMTDAQVNTARRRARRWELDHPKAPAPAAPPRRRSSFPHRQIGA